MQEILLFVQAHTLPIVAGIVGLFLLIQLILQIKLVRKMSRMQKKIDTITDKVGEYLAVVMDPENEVQEEKADADLKISQEKMQREEEETRIISAVLQEIFP